ncbi:MAG: rod shape-determining protein MreC [Bdellovibrionales bacterium RIFOXYD1_FULL_44_7]|nr:MAG: rod shape-determining protein MreC [Bdellovibrionales bacterium RIFOXYD1_FULL_44_7]
MIKYLKEYRFYITLFLFLLIPIIAIDTATRAPRDYRVHDRVILTITAPIQKLISWSLDQLASGFQNYIYLWHTRRDNLSLLEENRRLLNLIASLRETQFENSRLRKLLQFQENFHLETVVARVVAKDVSTEFRAIRINRGEASGIKKNMAVMTNEGVVGRVLRTTKTTADVVTILDLQSAVDAIIERSRARGVMEGMTDEVCQLRFVLRTDDIEPGDVLVSSGLEGVFPKGIPVGTVSKVKRKPFGITQEVEVRPSVDFSKLEEVLVVTKVVHEPVASSTDETKTVKQVKQRQHEQESGRVLND